MKRLACLLLLASLLSTPGYAKGPRPESLSPDSLFLVGKEAYQEGNCRNVISCLDYYVLHYPTRPDVDSAQYYLAYSYYGLKRFEEATTEFSFLYKQFPSSSFAEEAQLRAAECTFEISEPYYREQKLTLDAQRMAQEFLDRYPDSDLAPGANELLVRIDEKLARKELEAAKLYFKFKEYEAAVMSLEYILSTYPLANEANAETSYYLALCKAKLGETEEAENLLKQLLEDNRWAQKAQSALEQLAKEKK